MSRARSPEKAGASESAEPSFEAALDRLEALVQELESGELSLEDSLSRFEEGQTLLRICTARLDAAELRVKQILQTADGALTETPLESSDDDA